MHRICKLAAGAAAIWLVAASAALAAPAPARIEGKPNLNGIWRAMSGANWDLEPHSAQIAPAAPEKLGAWGAIPASVGVVVGGEIPYLPEALEQREKNRRAAPAADPEAACYLPGIPRATYMDHSFQIVQGDNKAILFVYEFHEANRAVEMKEVEVPAIDTWMGTSYGSWEGDTLKVITLAQGQSGSTWLDRAGNYITPTATVTERFKPNGPNHIAYEATIEDPAVFSKPWKIAMTLYRNMEPNAQLMEFNCVPFSELLLYGDLLTNQAPK